MKHLTKTQKWKVEQAVKKARWHDSLPSKTVNKPEDECWPEKCWHIYWCIDYPAHGGRIQGLMVTQAWSAREAKDEIYRLAARILRVKL